MPFRALGLGNHVLHAITDAGYVEPTPIQKEAIPPILAGRDLIGIAQTGTGKTAAFVLPMLARLDQPAMGVGRGTRALVIAPTRELVLQIEENARAYGKYLPMRMAVVYGGVGERPQIDALRQGADIVIATPGRFLDLTGRRHGNFSKLEFLVLDEADRMLDMGFLPQIRQIVRGLPKERQTMLFSATLSAEIESITREFLRDPKLVQIGRRANPAETVAQFVYEVPKHLKPALLGHLLKDDRMNMVLVFTRTKHGADRVARKLTQLRVASATLHSNRSQAQRLRALKDFKSGTARVLVATDIAARGIDVDGISHVVNFDFPPHPEDYVHRIGRTGRAHAVGDAISFVTPEDHGALRSLERFIGRGIVRKRAEGFDYAAAGPPRSEAPGHGRPHGPPRGRRQGQGHATSHPRRPQRQGKDARRRGKGQGGAASPLPAKKRGWWPWS